MDDVDDNIEDILPKRKPRSTYQVSPETPLTKIKIISLGEMNVGKSCLIKRFCEERFVDKYIATIGVDYGVKSTVVEKIDDKDSFQVDVKVSFWDMSGHSTFFEVRNEFYKETQGIILVYDVNSRKSFDALENWLQEASKYGASNPAVIVCGNKSDLLDNVSIKKGLTFEKEAKQWAYSKGFKFFETSAKTGENVKESFTSLFNLCLEHLENKSTNNSAKIASSYKDPSSFQASGVTIVGVKYLVIRADARSVYGKKGAGGAIVVKTAQSIIIGIYNETIQPGQATTVVERLADYLIENGY